MTLSFVYKSLEVRETVGEFPKLRFNIRAKNDSDEKAVILKLSGEVNIGPRPGEIGTLLGRCTSDGLYVIPPNQEEIIHLIIDIPWAKVKAIENIREGIAEILFSIYLEGAYANVYNSRNGEFQISALGLIRSQVKSYLRDGTSVDHILVNREEWAGRLAKLKYGELKIVELPIVTFPEPILGELKTAVTDLENALKYYKKSDPLTCVMLARNALSAITETRPQEKRKIREEIKKYILERTPETLKDHLKDVLDRLDDVIGKTFHFASKFVKEQPIPDRPIYPPTQDDAEFSMNLVADMIRYIINIVNRAIAISAD